MTADLPAVAADIAARLYKHAQQLDYTQHLRLAGTARELHAAVGGNVDDMPLPVRGEFDPDWMPLTAIIPADQLGDWMWMGNVIDGGTTIEQYKHRQTRGYLNLSADGRMWRVEYSFVDPWDPSENASIATVEPVTEEQAFQHAGVWPWSRHDPNHPWPAWMPGPNGEVWS